MPQSTKRISGKPVVAALDLSEESTACLKHACQMAAELDQPLIVLHVAHETVETAGGYRRHCAQDTTPLVEVARRVLDDRITGFRDSCDAMEQIGDVFPLVVEGLPANRIAEVAERFDAAMIVMCSHDRHGLSRWLHNSVAHAVSRRAKCPVLIIGDATPPLTMPPRRHSRGSVTTPAPQQA